MGIRLDDYIGYCELGTLYGYGSNFKNLPVDVRDAIDDMMSEADFVENPLLNPDNMWLSFEQWTFEDAKNRILNYEDVVESEIDHDFIVDYIESTWWFIGEFNDIYYFFYPQG